MKREEVVKRVLFFIFMLIILGILFGAFVIFLSYKLNSIWAAFLGGCLVGGVITGLFIWYWIDEVKEE